MVESIGLISSFGQGPGQDTSFTPRIPDRVSSPTVKLASYIKEYVYYNTLRSLLRTLVGKWVVGCFEYFLGESCVGEVANEQ